MTSQEKLIKEIKSLSDSIRRKNRALRLGISERDRFLETTFKPVIDPLKQVSQKLGKVTEGELILPITTSDVEHEEINDSEEQIEDETDEEDKTLEQIEHERRKDTSEEDEFLENDPSNISRLGTDIKYKGDLSRKYVLKMLQSAIPNRKYHVYGARLEGQGLMIGNSRLDIDDEDNIIVGDKRYNGTQGLFELIFKQKPVKYNHHDLSTFKQILVNTNAHKKNYESLLPIHRNTSVKYKNIISKLFPSQMEKTKKRFMSSEEAIPFPIPQKKRKLKEQSSSGSGLLKDSYSTNIIYYNDVNKLVNRMRLIHEAMEAGHTGLQNEWVALVDELLMKGIIQGS